MIVQNITFYIIITLSLIAILVVSIVIPFIGFINKRWKGLAIGCLAQPIFCAVVFLLVVLGALHYQKRSLSKYRETAIVTLRKTVTDDNGNHSYTWYLKGDDECLFEMDEPRHGRYSDRKREDVEAKLFDIIPLDSCSVCVDDVVVVKFDFDNRTVTATDYDEPIEVVSINWDRVKDYFARLAVTKVR